MNFFPHLQPMDTHNQTLLNNVHPPDWRNPRPAPRYNLAVLGAGTAGLVAAMGAAGLGAKVALIERNLMGGDCLNFGCVPSKAILRSARAAAASRHAHALGINAAAPADTDFAQVMARMRRLRAEISENDAAKRFANAGIDVFLGAGRFLDAQTIEVAGERIRFAKAVVCTGASPTLPSIPGIPPQDYLTSESVFTLTDLPPRLCVMGGGPIGCELSQAFARFGSEVHLVEAAPRLLPREDHEAAAIIRDALTCDGVIVHTGARVKQITCHNAEKCITLDAGDAFLADAVLAALGRSPNLAGLNLEAAGVACDPANGIHVDDTLRTTNPRIYAAGDVCMAHKFTHAADFAARTVLRNALFPFLPKARLSRLVVPWCIYTDPELAQVGITEEIACKEKIPVDIYRVPMDTVDRALLDNEKTGFVKILCAQGTGSILGATFVGAHAGESIGELVLAIASGTSLGKLASVIHPYPTQAEAIRKAGDLFNKTRLTPRTMRWLQRIMAWQR
jgi:pyruvate/2-oxoglutarate dehydrogenase complex dihydrolipoamide dehydrogenase (E3) component